VGLQEGLMMNADIPKVWNTPFIESSESRDINYILHDNSLANRVALSRMIRDTDERPLPQHLVPEHFYFSQPDLTKDYRASTPDWGNIHDGLHLVSEKFRNLATDLDFGANEFFEIPLYENDHKTRRPTHWFLFHICETKDTLVAEQSTGLEQDGVAVGCWRSQYGEEVLAVKASATTGVDLWVERRMAGRIFLSDRLMSALKAPGMQMGTLEFRPCIVVP
jgi:hypothetical protein